MRQHLRSSGKQAATPSRSNSHSDRADRHTMVSITGYDDSSSASAARPSKTYPDDTAGYGSLGYGNIAGAPAFDDTLTWSMLQPIGSQAAMLMSRSACSARQHGQIGW